MAGNKRTSTTAKKGRPKGRKPQKSAVLEPEVMPRHDVKPDLEEDTGEEHEDLNIEEMEPSTEEIQGSLPATIPEAQLPDTTEFDVGSVSATDPLRRYLEEVRRYTLLDPESEFQLAMQLKEKGDMTAAKRLVAANLRLVVKIAFEYRNMYSNVLDLIQEGNIGLMKAVSKFDPTKGARLGYYASWWIRSYILKYLLDNFRLVKIGTTQAQKKLFYHLLREKERLEAQGLLAGPKLLAEKLDVREKDVIEMEQRLSSRGTEMPLDAPIESSGGKVTHLDQLPDGQEAADEELARRELLKLLQERLPDFQARLNDKELKILQERLLAEEPKTLQEVADQYGLTRERARQIEVKVIQKLREYMASEGWPV